MVPRGPSIFTYASVVNRTGERNVENKAVGFKIPRLSEGKWPKQVRRPCLIQRKKTILPYAWGENLSICEHDPFEHKDICTRVSVKIAVIEI